MDRFKNITIIALTTIVCLLLLLRGCEKPKVKTIKEVSFKSDTIYSKDTLVRFKTIIRPKHDTIYKVDTLFEDIPSDTIFYVRKYNDSLVSNDLTIYSKIKVIGLLDKLDISYKLKPKPILITNNIIETKEVIKNSKVSAYGGLELGGNESKFTISPYFNINIDKTSLTYRYGVMDKTHNIGVGYNIFSSKK